MCWREWSLSRPFNREVAWGGISALENWFENFAPVACAEIRQSKDPQEDPTPVELLELPLHVAQCCQSIHNKGIVLSLQLQVWGAFSNHQMQWVDLMPSVLCPGADQELVPEGIGVGEKITADTQFDLGCFDATSHEFTGKGITGSMPDDAINVLHHLRSV